MTAGQQRFFIAAAPSVEIDWDETFLDAIVSISAFDEDARPLGWVEQSLD